MEGSPPSKLVTPEALRSPEDIFGDTHEIGFGQDIWGFGCIMYEFLTGDMLFQVEPLMGKPFDEAINDEHLIQITETIGLLPDRLLNRWCRKEKYYLPDAGRRDDIDDKDEDGVGLADVGSLQELECRLDALEVSEEEREDILCVLRMALELDYQKRASATTLLQHPWFQNVQTPLEAGYSH